MYFFASIFSILSSFLLFILADPKIVVVWGEPETFTSFSTHIQTETYWTDCINECLDDEQCVLIADTGTNCQLFQKGNVAVVNLLVKDSGKRVGFKRTMDECPNSNEEPPLFGEKSVKESTYTLVLDSANRQIQFNIACDNDSSLLKRGSQQACFTCVLFPDPYMGNFAQAQELCLTGNRIGITGPYSSVEIPKMSDKCTANLRDSWNLYPENIKAIKYADFWMDGICGDGKDPVECTYSDPSLTSYEKITDKYPAEGNVYCAFTGIEKYGINLAGCDQTGAASNRAMRGAVCLTKPL